MFDADDGRQAFADVVARESVVLEEFLFLGVAVDAAGQRRAQAGHVRAAVFVANDVRVAHDALAERIRPLKRKFDGYGALLDLFFSGDDDGFWMERLPASVDLLHEFGDAASVVVLNCVQFFGSLVGDDNAEACVEKRCFFEATVDLIEIKFHDVGENGAIGLERDDGPGVVARTDDFEVRYAYTGFKTLLVDGAVSVNFNIHPFGNGVHGRNADAVQTSADLVGTVVEFTTGVKFGHDDFGGRYPEFFVLVDRNASAVVSNRERVIRVKNHFNDVVESSKVFVNGVVHDLPDAVVQGRTVVRIAKVHPGSFSDGFKPFENLDASSVVIFAQRIASELVWKGVLRPVLDVFVPPFPPSKYTARHGV